MNTQDPAVQLNPVLFIYAIVYRSGQADTTKKTNDNDIKHTHIYTCTDSYMWKGTSEMRRKESDIRRDVEGDVGGDKELRGKTTQVSRETEGRGISEKRRTKMHHRGTRKEGKDGRKCNKVIS